MRGSSSGAPRRRRSAYERMGAVLRDWDALFAEMGEQMSGRTTRVRASYARTAARFRPRWQRAERELDELRSAADGGRSRPTLELERTLAELRELFTNVRIE
jgi:hypothetical protein